VQRAGKQAFLPPSKDSDGVLMTYVDIKDQYGDCGVGLATGFAGCILAAKSVSWLMIFPSTVVVKHLNIRAIPRATKTLVITDLVFDVNISHQTPITVLLGRKKSLFCQRAAPAIAVVQ